MWTELDQGWNCFWLKSTHSLWCVRWGISGSYTTKHYLLWASQVALVVKNPPASAGDVGDMGSIPGSGRNPGEGNGNPLQYSCLESPMDRGAWHRIAESQTWLKQLNTCYLPWPVQDQVPASDDIFTGFPGREKTMDHVIRWPTLLSREWPDFNQASFPYAVKK